jgi:hypothetical protein
VLPPQLLLLLDQFREFLAAPCELSNAQLFQLVRNPLHCRDRAYVQRHAPSSRALGHGFGVSLAVSFG